MARRDMTEFRLHNSYLGCEVPKPFFLRYQAMCAIRGEDKRAIQAKALEAEILKWERKIPDKTLVAYQALLEIKARQNGFYVKDLTADLVITPKPRGRRKPNTKPAPWPKIKKG